MEKPNRRRRSRKTGMPPGSLVHIGEKRDFATKINAFRYRSDAFEEIAIDNIDQCQSLVDANSVTWINIDGIHETQIIENIGKQFKLHPLTLEDIVNNEQRPKLEEHDHYLFCVLKMLYPLSPSEAVGNRKHKIVIEQVSLLVGKNFVLSFQESVGADVFGGIRDRIRNNHGKMRRVGSDYLAYALMDAIVDHYFIVLEKTGERLETLETELLSDPQQRTLNTLQILKRDLIDLRKSIWPLREVLSALQRLESDLITDNTKQYLRDVYDHTIHVVDTIEAYRDLSGGMLEIYMSSVSNRLNAIMKVLTMISTIFIPLNFIVGVYGMNFAHMPELRWEHGYHFVWAIMILLVSSMVIFFKRQRWL